MTLKRWGQEKETKNIQLKTTSMMRCGSQAGELAASDTTNEASEVISVSWPGQAARLSHACPALPVAEPQTFPGASSHSLAHSFSPRSPGLQHVRPTLSQKGRQRGFRNEHAQGRQPRCHSMRVLDQEISKQDIYAPSLTPKRWPCTIKKSGQGNGPRVVRNVDFETGNADKGGNREGNVAVCGN